MTKRILALITAALILAVLTPVAALSESTSPVEVYSGTCGENITWELDTETGVLTLSGFGEMYDYGSFTDVPWFVQRSSVTSLSIDDGITHLGDHAFFSTGLTNVSIPNSVKTIGVETFACCPLQELAIPAGVTSIGCNAFSNCGSLYSVSFGRRVSSIDPFAFYQCTGIMYATFYGAPPETMQQDIFADCGEDLRIAYTTAYAQEWRMYDPITWHGHPMVELPNPFIPGDADGNGRINANDALVVLRVSLGISESLDAEAADVNGDGIINAADALLILRDSLGIITL